MAQSDRPLRADAARNRARVLEVAYDTFATEGLSVPIDEIARRAGVGAGTVYRHFPAKEDLFRAVVEDRIQRIIDEGRSLLDAEEPGEALFAFMRSMVLAVGCDGPWTGGCARWIRYRRRDRDARRRRRLHGRAQPSCCGPRRKPAPCGVMSTWQT